MLTPVTSFGFDAFTTHSTGLGEDFDVYVGLPWNPPIRDDGRYAVLVVLDAMMTFGTALETCRTQAWSGEVEPVVVVGVTVPRQDGIEVASLRRTRHFSASAPSPDGLVTRMVHSRREAAGLTLDDAFGGADLLLKFLVESVLPDVAERYPVTMEGLGLLGHSAGGSFAAHAMLQPVTPFARFVIGSFSLDFLTAGKEFVPDSRRPRVFFGMGEKELDNPVLASTLLPGRDWLEDLAARGTIQLTSQVFTNASHTSLLGPLISQGVADLFGTGRGYAQDATAP